MPAVPLPFIVTGVLVLVVLRLAKHLSRDRWLIVFVGACALQTALVGLRWSVGLDWVHLVQPVLAACLPLFALAAFRSLRDEEVSYWHGIWPVAVMLSWWLLPSAVDPLLIVEFIAYGLIVLGMRFPEDTLTHVRIGDEWTVSRARNGVALLLILSALSDTIVSFALAEGKYAAAAMAVAAMMGVILVGLAGGILGWTVAAMPGDEGEPAPAEPPPALPETEEEQAIIAAVEAALARGLFRDYDLTLQRLSRRTRIPARKISRAVNRVRGCTVTDLVNGYRVHDAMRLLRESDLPVTQIMLEAGFQTKSNFNRTFKEIAGQTPSAYRNSGNE